MTSDDPEKPLDDDPSSSDLSGEESAAFNAAAEAFPGPSTEDLEDAGFDADEELGEEAAEEEKEVVIEYADHKVPSAKIVLSAMQWAFENEAQPEGFVERCAEHALMVLKAAKRMNIIKMVDPREVAAKHYLESWRTVEQLPLLGRTVLDVGSGGGFPGIAIALAEVNTRVLLLEEDEEKHAFLEECIEKLKLPNATAICERAEEYLLKNRVDVVFMREMSSVRENVRLLRKVRHSLYDLVMLKGASWSREVRAGEREAERLGFRLDTILEHELPDEMGKRAALVYRAPGGQGR